jgi:hypothetical protein
VEQSSAQSKLVKMTPAELELLIDKIMEDPSVKKKRVLLWKSSNSIKESIF